MSQLTNPLYWSPGRRVRGVSVLTEGVAPDGDRSTLLGSESAAITAELGEMFTRRAARFA